MTEEGAGRRRNQCGDSGLTSDEIPGQGNIVAGLLYFDDSSRGPGDEVIVAYHRGPLNSMSLPDPNQETLIPTIGKCPVKPGDHGHQKQEVQSDCPAKMPNRLA